MLDTTTITITSSKMAKNYSHCPLKKRPVLQEFNVKEDIIPTPPPQIIENDIADEPENLSTKPEDLSRRTGADSTYPKVCSPPQAAAPVTPIATVPTIPRLGGAFHRVAPLSPEPIHYAPTTWHISVAPTINTTQAPHYPPAYFPMGYPYSPATESYHHRYPLYPSPPARYAPRDNSCSPPQIHNQRTPLASLALIPEPRRCGPLDRASLSPASSGAASVRSHSPTSSNEPADLSSPPTLPINESRRITSARHQCPDCGKSYSTFSGLSKHRQFHCAAGDGPRKSFSCKYCDKVYVSLGALKMHIRTHTLPCRCTMCGKAFSRPWLLQGHIRTHTGEKPFSCQYCHRAFADRSNLRAHLQTHSDVKKYSCQTCNKMFSRMSLLTKHAEGGCSGGNNGAQIYAVPQQEQQIY